MKRKKIFRIIVISTAIVFVGVYLFLKFSWLTLYSFDDMKQNAKIVDSSISPPDNFLKVWDKLYPESRNNGMTKQLWGELTRKLGNSKFHDCKCDEIGYLAWNNNNHSLKFNVDKGLGKYRQFGYGLQYYTTPAKCFDFWLNNGIIWNGHYLKDLNELAVINFKKNVAYLNEVEIIELIAYRNLGYYRSKDLKMFQETVTKLAAKLTDIK